MRLKLHGSVENKYKIQNISNMKTESQRRRFADGCGGEVGWVGEEVSIRSLQTV